MPSPCAQAPTLFDLSAVQVGRSVTTGHVGRWAEEASFLGGANLHIVGGGFALARPAGRTSLAGLTYSLPATYVRSAGAQVLMVVAEMAPGDGAGTQTVAVTLPAGASWIEAGGLDGSRNFPNATGGRTSMREYVGFANVDGCTVGSVLQAVATSTPVASPAQGLRRLSLVEVPLKSLDPVGDVTEPGLDQAWTLPPSGGPPMGRIVDGGASSPRGVQRLFYVLDQARANWRKHLNVVGVESADVTGSGTTPHWFKAGAGFGAISWLYPSGSGDPRWYVATRRLYGALATTYTFRVRYRTASNTVGGSVRLYAEGGAISGSAWVPAAAAVATSLTLPATNNAWTWASKSVTLPGDGTDMLVRVWFDADAGGAGELLCFANLALVEAEP